MAKHGKRYRSGSESIDRNVLYQLEEAVKMVKERAGAKFDETIEVAMNLGVDPRHADQMVRGVCKLPNGSGRKVRVAVICQRRQCNRSSRSGCRNRWRRRTCPGSAGRQNRF